MQHLDLLVVRQALQWSAAGRRVWLCTVLSTYGSAPRAPGSLLAATAEGEWIGSLSGGCVEDEFLERLAAGACDCYRSQNRQRKRCHTRSSADS